VENIMSNGKMLLNKAHVRDYILSRQGEIRPGWTFEYVSSQVYDDLNEKVRLAIDGALRRHPSKGKTFSQIM